jgi:biopolymer transport protein ExbD
MFATTASFPNVMEIAMPEANIEVPVSPVNLLTLYVGGEGALFYSTGLAPRMRRLPASELKAFIVARNAERGNELITALKVDPSARYERLICVLDELNIAEADLTDGYAARGVKRERRFAIAAMTPEEREVVAGRR